MSGVNTDDMRQTVRNALYDWAERVLTDDKCLCPIVWDDTGGVREVPPFIAFQLLLSVRRGYPYMSGVDEATGEVTARHDMKMTVSVHGYGKGAMERLEVLRDGIHWSEYIAMLRKRGLVINAITDVKEAGQDVSNERETRGYFDISITFIRVVTKQVDWISGVDIEQGIKGGFS